MGGDDRPTRRVRVRHARVQPRPVRRAAEDRLIARSRCALEGVAGPDISELRWTHLGRGHLPAGARARSGIIYAVLRTTTIVALLASLLVGCGASVHDGPDAGDAGSNDTNPVITIDAGTPTTLASSASPFGVAVDGTHVYWTDVRGRSVMKVPLAGGTPVTLASDQEQAFYLAVDATYVYWTVGIDPGAVMKVPLEGGTPVTIASGQMNPEEIAVDATSVYWTTFGALSSDKTGTIMKAPLGGGAPAMLASGQSRPVALAVDATAVYWTNFGSAGATGAVMKVPLAGGSPVALATEQAFPREIAIDGDAVYWANQGGEGTVMKVPLAGGTPTVLASAQRSVGGLAVDATDIYWTQDSGPIVRMSKSGGALMEFGPVSIQPIEMALDQTRLYWTDIVAGTVSAIDKP